MLGNNNHCKMDPKVEKLVNACKKLRSDVLALKKYCMEEQKKNAVLREQLRQRETDLRRSEQEMDSINFRNKQLEHRVAVLQEELSKQESRKNDKDQKRHIESKTDKNWTCSGASGTRVMDNNGGIGAQDTILFEELQKKIMENAQLTSLIDDKERELQLHSERVQNLEKMLQKRLSEHNEMEERLRRELDTAQCRNAELETKYIEATSMLGSEDALSASGSDNTPLHSLDHNHTSLTTVTTTTTMQTNEERVSFLEQEVAHWRAQFEILKLNETFGSNKTDNNQLVNAKLSDANCSCTSTAAGITVKNKIENKGTQQRDALKEPQQPPEKEELIYNNFSKKYEDLLRNKYIAESRVASYETEAENLQNCLENATHELKEKDEQIKSINQALQLLEEDLTTTRTNYEQQISVLTEQIIHLSDQLAACK